MNEGSPVVMQLTECLADSDIIAVRFCLEQGPSRRVKKIRPPAVLKALGLPEVIRAVDPSRIPTYQLRFGVIKFDTQQRSSERSKS
jgi:hypothetical protein